GAGLRQLLLGGLGRHLRGGTPCPGAARAPQRTRRRAGRCGRMSGKLRVWVRRLAPIVVLVIFATLPYSSLNIPVLFAGAINSPGRRQLLAVCLVFAGLALGYDLMFGRTGMLSFGHALYFAAGGYGTAILLAQTDWPLWTVAVVSVLGAAVLAALLG